jgi:hypothetical protein
MGAAFFELLLMALVLIAPDTANTMTAIGMIIFKKLVFIIKYLN